MEQTKHERFEIRNFQEYEVPLVFHPYLVNKKDTLYNINWHEELELLFMLDGKVKAHLGTEVFYAEKGDVIVANSRIIHNLVPLTETTAHGCFIIDANFCNYHGFSYDKVHIKEIIRDERLFKYMENIKQAMVIEKPKYYTADVVSNLLQILIILFREYAEGNTSLSNVKPSSSTTDIVEKSIEYIKQHFKENLSIEDIANHTGYSKFYLCKRFKEITGYTVNTYLNMRKIKYAHNELINTGRSIIDVATECGFHDISYFRKTFKKYAGLSPSNVKKYK